MDPFTLGAIGISGMSLLAGAANNADVNRNNLRIAREQMAFNKEEAQKQRDFQAQQAEVARSYDSAVNQVARLREAGLNPYLAGVSPGSATVASAGSAASSPSPPHLQPYDFVAAGQGISQSMLQAAAVDKTRQDTQVSRQQGIGLEIENQYKHLQLQTGILRDIANINNSNMDTSLKEWTINELKQQYQFNQETWDARKQGIEAQVDLMKAQKEQAISQASLNVAKKVTEDAQREVNIRLSKAQINGIQQQVKESVERIEQIRSNVKLTDASKLFTDQRVKSEILDGAKKVLEMVGIDNQNKMYPKMLRQVESEIRKNYTNSLGLPFGVDIPITDFEYYTHGGEMLP